jgi:hypothetical protein
VTPVHVADPSGASPNTTVTSEPDEHSAPEPGATTSSGPEHRDDLPELHPDDGRESDD